MKENFLLVFAETILDCWRDQLIVEETNQEIVDSEWRIGSKSVIKQEIENLENVLKTFSLK